MIIVTVCSTSKLSDNQFVLSPHMMELWDGNTTEITDVAEQTRYWQILQQYLNEDPAYTEQVPSFTKSFICMYLNPVTQYSEAVFTCGMLRSEYEGGEHYCFMVSRMIKYSDTHSWDHYWQLIFQQVIQEWLMKRDDIKSSIMLWSNSNQPDGDQDLPYSTILVDNIPPAQIEQRPVKDGVKATVYHLCQ